MEHEEYDIIIVGAGPAGCTCAYQLAGTGLKIGILEKDIFPRDKICGDALSADVINQFSRMNPELAQQFQKLVSKTTARGVRVFSASHQSLDVSLNNLKSSGYVARRTDFDNFYFNQLNNLPDIRIFQGHKVIEVNSFEDGVVLKTDKSTFRAQIVVGADGANSIINRKLIGKQIDKAHHMAGLRQYFENVSGFHEDHIELHFYKELVPGYFWIFPLPNGQANVGLGMLSSTVSKKQINLKQKLQDIIQNHPNVRHRFKNAKPMESIKGFGLPIGSRKRQCSGNRFLLLGDAAGLIDPFTGEGIANAIRSGRIAAGHLRKAFQLNRFDSEYNSLFDKEIYSKMWSELLMGRSLQKLSTYPQIFNFLINKGNTNESVRALFTSMLDNVDIKKRLLKPSFYFKLFFS